MKDSRQDRLKSALRENLKRRKSQARERDEQRNKTTSAPSNDHEDVLDDHEDVLDNDTGSGGGG
jgi:hypothetical protein